VEDDAGIAVGLELDVLAGFMWVSWVSLKLATTQTSDSDAIERRVWPDWTNWPGSTFLRETMPEIGAVTVAVGALQPGEIQSEAFSAASVCAAATRAAATATCAFGRRRPRCAASSWARGRVGGRLGVAQLAVGDGGRLEEPVSRARSLAALRWRTRPSPTFARRRGRRGARARPRAVPLALAERVLEGRLGLGHPSGRAPGIDLDQGWPAATRWLSSTSTRAT
jgi:hypothetical protein